MEVRSRIFDAFVTTRSQGVGIGLAVVKQIVDAHGGRITVDDSPGGGTTFRVVLPKRAPVVHVSTVDVPVAVGSEPPSSLRPEWPGFVGIKRRDPP